MAIDYILGTGDQTESDQIKHMKCFASNQWITSSDMYGQQISIGIILGKNQIKKNKTPRNCRKWNARKQQTLVVSIMRRHHSLHA